MSPKVSIIVPAYNAARTLADCLDACTAQTYPDTEIIVVDDGSTDTTRELVRARRIALIEQPNAGPAAARNRGAAAAEGEFLAFTDSDCVPAPDWIACLVSAFGEVEEVAGVGGTYDIRNRDSLLARMIHEEIVMRHEGFRKEVDFLGSFNVAYRREAFVHAGGFDPAFRAASGEDNDLAYRLHDAGGRLLFCPQARVAHVHPSRLIPYLRTQLRHGYWRMKLYAKHPARASGDQYAGPADLFAPAIPFALAAMLAVALTARFLPMWILFGLSTAFYGGMKLRPAWALCRRSGDPAMLAFAVVGALRDAARGLGLVGGLWHFVLRRKESA